MVSDIRVDVRVAHDTSQAVGGDAAELRAELTILSRGDSVLPAVSGEQVTVRGFVDNGVIKIGTVFIP